LYCIFKTKQHLGNRSCFLNVVFSCSKSRNQVILTVKTSLHYFLTGCHTVECQKCIIECRIDCRVDFKDRTGSLFIGCKQCKFYSGNITKTWQVLNPLIYFPLYFSFLRFLYNFLFQYFNCFCSCSVIVVKAQEMVTGGGGIVASPTPWSRIFEKLIGRLPVKKFPVFYVN
jgi:hypothetical protein